MGVSPRRFICRRSVYNVSIFGVSEGAGNCKQCVLPVLQRHIHELEQEGQPHDAITRSLQTLFVFPNYVSYHPIHFFNCKLYVE